MKAALVVLMLTLIGTPLVASGYAGIYGVISKVVFEPNDRFPERIQIWGAFTLVEGGAAESGATLTPRRGYLYFALPAAGSQRETALKEWADFKTIAGTGQAVAFGYLPYIGSFADELISRPAGMPPYLLLGGIDRSGRGGMAKNVLRSESAVPAAPDIYPMSIGLVKLSSTGSRATIVSQLQQLLKP